MYLQCRIKFNRIKHQNQHFIVQSDNSLTFKCKIVVVDNSSNASEYRYMLVETHEMGWSEKFSYESTPTSVQYVSFHFISLLLAVLIKIITLIWRRGKLQTIIYKTGRIIFYKTTSENNKKHEKEDNLRISKCTKFTTCHHATKLLL